jgi:hypothetical protein
LGDKGYHGYDQTQELVITPYKGRNKPESQKDANRAHARLRGPGERANAQLMHWRIGSDGFGDGRSCPLGVRAGMSVAATEADRSRQLVG